MANLPWRSERPPQLDGIRVLLVDDMPDMLELVGEILTHVGATVIAVGSAEEALGALQGERPDVLLSDLTMPGKGWYWLIGQVRALPEQRGGSTPAAALTAHTGPEHRARVLRAGFQRHLEKPIGPDALVRTVAALAGWGSEHDQTGAPPPGARAPGQGGAA